MQMVSLSDTSRVWLLKDTNNVMAGLDYDESFSLMVKPATIQFLLYVDLSHEWNFCQLELEPDHYCQFVRSMYGPK
jgi:hypothetical protein